ncbi:unnamed protein product [Urochloa humidicola]
MEIGQDAPRRTRRPRNHHPGLPFVTAQYSTQSSSIEEALERIRCGKRQRDQFCPLLSEEASKKRRLSRIKKRRQQRLVDAGLAAFVRSSASRDVIPREYAEALKAIHPGRCYIGRPDYKCQYCGAVFWYHERVKSESALSRRRLIYNMCCKAGKVRLPSFSPPPELLSGLLKFDGGPRSKAFLQKIRHYNSLFAFTSMGASIDRTVNNGNGPPVFKISGQVCHRIGSLLPAPGDQPKFAQLYIYDTTNELANRIGAIQSEDSRDGGICPQIAAELLNMLDEINPLVKQFRIARDRLAEHSDEEIGIRIVGATENDPVQYEMPTACELAGLIIGDFSKENYKRDIIVHGTNGVLHRVSCLHPAYMPLQYPLLFPYGERGYQLGIRYQGSELFDDNCRAKVTMLDHYCYRCHYRMDEPNPFLCYGKLSEQAKVDSYACVEESRLKYINDHQDDFRSEYFQGIVDAVGKGTLDASSIGKKKFLPASFTGGRRYMTQNYQDALAICRVHGCPDWFTTFTCNPKWIELMESLETEPGQQPADRSDFIVRVYKIKLDEMMDDIKDGTAFGPIVAVLQSTEFQKRGLPHAHILVWVKKDGKEGTCLHTQPPRSEIIAQLFCYKLHLGEKK